ncbi:hypothetical protein KI387_020015 [Taxus chinensis]|uniref:Uncharacterized protein n=1 Tax=Taxus chinensis TaxID=29808 RepID=A0AA38LBX2_TAXCH|nr:hypothetical protein KI387_020015 [Taxus chinensis]
MDAKDANQPDRPKQETSTQGHVGQRDARDADSRRSESQSDHATCHRQKRDMEAHFRWIGGFCPAKH